MIEKTETGVLNIYSDEIRILLSPKKEEAKKEEKKEKPADLPRKSRVIAIVLALFLGRYGIHKFYLGEPAAGFVYLMLSQFEIMVLISFIDAVLYVFIPEKAWIEKVGVLKTHKKKK